MSFLAVQPPGVWRGWEGRKHIKCMPSHNPFYSSYCLLLRKPYELLDGCLSLFSESLIKRFILVHSSNAESNAEAASGNGLPAGRAVRVCRTPHSKGDTLQVTHLNWLSPQASLQIHQQLTKLAV